MRSAGGALFAGLCAAVAFILLVFGFLAFAAGGGFMTGGLFLLAFIVGFVGWVCDYSRDRTTTVARAELNEASHNDGPS